jgi:hypothetical protein
MSFLQKLILLLMAATSVPVGYVFYSAAFSSHDWVYQGHGQRADAGQHGAPGDADRHGAPAPSSVLDCLCSFSPVAATGLCDDTGAKPKS